MNSLKKALFSKLLCLVSVCSTGDTTSQSLASAITALSVVISISFAGTISFLIYRRGRYLQANKTQTRAEQGQDDGLTDEVPIAMGNVYVDVTEEHSYFELRPLKGPQGESSTENHYDELQGKVKFYTYI